MADGKVVIETSLDSKGFERQLNSLGSVAKTGAGVAVKAISGMGIALAGAGGFAIKTGADFEAGMSRVKAISGATDTQLKKLTDQAKQLGADTAFSAREASAGMENLASAGFSVEETMKAMPGLLNLAAVSGGDVAGSAETAAGTLRAFGLDATKAGHVADVFARAAADTNAETADMGEAMKYVGPAAKSMGLSLEETAAAIGVMSDANIKGSQAGTTLRGALSRLAKPTKLMRGTMDELGLSFYDAQGNMLPLKDQITMLEDAFKGLTAEEKNQALVTLYGQESLSGMMALIEAGPGKLDQVTQSLVNSDGAAADMAATIQDNLKGAVEELSGSAETLAIELYQSVDNPLNDIVKRANGHVDQLIEAFNKDGMDGLSTELGIVFADAVTEMAKGGSKLIKSASGVVKSFAKGIVKNRKQITDAAVDVAKAFADGVADLLPKGVANSVRNITSAFASVAKPTLNAAGAVLELTSKFSGFIPVVAGAIAVLKLNSFLNKTAVALKLLKVGQDATTNSVRANTLAQRINAVQTKTTGAAKAASTAFESAYSASLAKSTTAVGVQTVAQRAMATGAGVAAVATKGLSAAMAFMGGPVGIAVTAIGALVGIMTLIPNKSSATSDALKKERETVKELTTEYKENHKARKEAYEDTATEARVAGELSQKVQKLADIENKSTSQKLELKGAVGQLNDLMPELNLSYDEQADKLSRSTDEIYNYIEAAKQQMYIDAASEQATAAIKDRINAQKALDDKKGKRDSAVTKLNGLETLHGGDISGEGHDKLIEQRDLVDQYNESVKKLDITLQTAKGDETYYTNLIQNGEILKKAVEEGKKIPPALAEGINAGKYGAVTSMKQLEQLVEFKGIAKEAGKAGKNAITVLTKQIQAKKLSPKQAIDEAQALVEFNKLPKASAEAGKKTINNFKKSIESGKTLPSEALRQANNALEKEAGKAPKAIDKSSKDMKRSSEKMVRSAKPTNAAATFKIVGTQAVAGAALGVGSSGLFSVAIAEMVRQGLEAGLKESDSHSPSRLFKRTLGTFIAQGTAVGITSGTKYSVAAMKRLVNTTANSVKNVNGNFSDIGEGFVSGFTSLIERGQGKAEKALEKKLNAPFKKNDAEEKVLQKRIKKASGTKKKALQKDLKELQKKHKAEEKVVTKANKKITAQYTKAYKAQADALIKQAEAQINAISDKYQEAYDKLIDRQNQVKDKLMDIDLGNNFSVTGLREINAGSITGGLRRNTKDLQTYAGNLDAIRGKVSDSMYSEILKMDVTEANKYIKRLLRMESGILATYVSDYDASQKQIADITTKQYKNSLIDGLDADVKAVQQYQLNLNSLKGRVPESMLEEILGMDTETANAYMTALNSMTTAEFNNYVGMWQQKENYAASISTNLVKDDIARLQADYTSEMNAAMDKLAKDTQALGKNVAKGFAKGMKSQKGNLSKEVKKICNAVIKKMKAEFGIKSPSKVTAKIFKQVIQGGEVGVVKEAPKLIKVADKTNGAFIERFKRANLDPELTVARMRQTVQSEMAQRPAAVTKLIHQIEDPNQGSSILSIEIKGGDIILDGRKTGQQLTRYVDIELNKRKVISER